MAIERFSSRREALGDVLTKRLSGASRYLRIAGYFRSSLLEVVGEALEGVGEIRVVCNGDLDPHDVKVAKAARDGQEALARTLVSSWQSTEDGLDLLLARERYRRLHDLLASGRMKVRVIPRDADNVFVHGKAGVIQHADGRTYSFVGSVNDSATAFRHAYEILWGDDDAGAADWVREEFEHFWGQGVDLPDAAVIRATNAGCRGRCKTPPLHAISAVLYCTMSGFCISACRVFARRPVMARQKTLRDMIIARMTRKAGEDVFLTREFTDLGGEDQVLRVLRGLRREGRLVHLGYGVYGRAFVSSLSGKPVLKSSNGFVSDARQALDKLGVEWEPTQSERAYNERRSAQIPVNPVVRVKGRFSRRLRYGKSELVLER